MTRIYTFMVGQSCRSALNSWAAPQPRKRSGEPPAPADDGKIFVLYLPAHFPLNYCSVHAAIMAHRGTDKKPTVGFQARFFLEGLDRRLSLRRNGLQRKKSQQTGKMRKKVQNNSSGTPVFLQNGLDFRPKTGLDKTHSLQVAPAVRVSANGGRLTRIFHTSVK
jgi:hypothetical protein